MAENKKGFSLLRVFRGVDSEKRGIRVDVTGSTDSLLATSPDFGVECNNKTALKVTAFYAGIRIISENIASLPKGVYKETDKGVASMPDHRVSQILNHPNKYTNKASFWGVIVTWLKDWGNAYAVILRDKAGNPVELHQIHPSYVNITVSEGRKWYKILSSDSATSWLNGVYKDEDILHFFDVTLDGIKGINPVVYNSVALNKSLAMDKFSAEYYRKGGNIRAVMETDGNLGDDKYESFMRHFQKASRNFDTPLLEYGIKYKQLSVNPQSAMLLESEIFSIQDVCRILGLPPHMVADLSHATFSNIEHQTIQFVQYTLRPIVKKIEVELESKLFFEREKGYTIKFSLDGLLRGDTAARSAYYHNAILDGYLSRNEVRELEGYEHKDGLDDMLFPLNSGVVGKETNNE